ncbi:hypothetical protein [Aeromicrobium camelliae]|uniref:hypothetical protein n=1 Tax=Aeromicrobium camelliae TaxID=1538144 RepID=UPI0014091FA8|nr:hypothetical protein [Aeromicrobium camelliae]
MPTPTHLLIRRYIPGTGPAGVPPEDDPGTPDHLAAPTVAGRMPRWNDGSVEMRPLVAR